MLTQQKTLPVWTPRHWQAFCYICNLALSVSFTKMFIAFNGGGGKWKKETNCFTKCWVGEAKYHNKWKICGTSEPFSFFLSLKAWGFSLIYLYRCNPFPFHHYVIYNLNLRDKTLGLPGEQLERSIPFAIENVDVLNVLCLTSPIESTPIFSDKYPSACNIYSSVLVSLQIFDGPSARSGFPAEAAPPVRLSQAHIKCSEMEAFIGLMDKMNEADAVKCRETDFTPRNCIIIVSIAPRWHLYLTFFRYEKTFQTFSLLAFYWPNKPCSLQYSCTL